MNLKTTRIHPTNLLPDRTEILEMDKATAGAIIQDLVNDLASMGTAKLVLRCRDGKDDRYFVFSIKKD
jgi:hypothetical protein